MCWPNGTIKYFIKNNNYLCFWWIERERTHGGDWTAESAAERMDKIGDVALELENVAKRGQPNNGFGTCNIFISHYKFFLSECNQCLSLSNERQRAEARVRARERESDGREH